MRVPYIVAIIFTIILLIVFGGRDPVKEAKREHALKMKQGDPLVNAIEEYNKKSNSFGSMFKNNKGVVFGQPRNNGNNPNTNSEQQDSGNAYPNGSVLSAEPQPQPGQQKTPDDSYYPPPPTDSSIPRSTLQDEGQPHSMNIPKNVIRDIPERVYSRAQFEANGNNQKIGFYGTRVFTLNAQGLPVPLPDGTYNLTGGGTVVVRDGEKMISGSFF